MILKARILLNADHRRFGARWTDDRIRQALATDETMVARGRRQWVAEGMMAVLARKKRKTPPIEPIFDGQARARLIALACSTPPPGHGRWSIRLLAARW